MKVTDSNNRIVISRNSSMVKRIARYHSDKYGRFTREQVAYIISLFMNEIFDDVKNGKSVTIRGFGCFSKGINKRTIYVMPNGKRVKCKERYKIVFTPTPTCVDRLNNTE